MRLPNGYGSITKLSGKRRRPWCVRVACKYSLDDSGKLQETRKVLGYYATKAEALSALAEYNSDPYDLSNRGLTFADVFSLWSAEKFPKVSIQTAQSRRASYKQCAALHDMPFKDIKLANLQGVMNINPKQSKSTANNIKVLFSALYDYAIKHDITDRDYSQYVELVYTDNTEPIHKAIPESVINDLWTKSDTDDTAALILIMIYTGWRINEFLNLEKIDLDNMTMQGGLKTEAGKHRIVPIHHRIQPLVIRLCRNGQLYHYSDKTFLKEFKKVLPDNLPHDTRHTFVSRLQSAHADHICIERLTGHSSTGVTDKIYTHKTVEELRAAIELLP